MLEINKNKQNCSVIILAAGKSSRMGTHKFALKFNEKHTFLEEIISQYQYFGCQEIIVVLNKEGMAYINKNSLNIGNYSKLIINEHLEWERFYSIKLGVHNLINSHPVFIHNVDNPFVNLNVLDKLFVHFSNTDYTVPVYHGKGGHPILLSKKIIKTISLEKKNTLIFSEFLESFDKKRIDVTDKNILVNINDVMTYHEFYSKNSS